MKLGARGPDVVALQTHLARFGYLEAREALGDFNARTDAALRAFQKNRGLTVDGDFGPASNLAIIPRAFPLRALADKRQPTITSRHSMHNPERPNHYGCDLFFAYKPDVDPPMKVGDGGRTARWWIPRGTMALAGAAGVVVNAGKSRTGYRLWIRHDGGQIATGYFHLRGLTPAVLVGARLELGAELGEVGDNPIDNDAAHLHFELYAGNIADDVAAGHYPRGTLDPERFLAGAEILN